MKYRVGIGQDSHCFLQKKGEKKCVVGGVTFEDVPGLAADSDGDVIFHAICNAITSLTHIPILGGIAFDLCHNHGITDSCFYLTRGVQTLQEGEAIEHIALTIEGSRPKFQDRSLAIRCSVAKVLKLTPDQVGITFTSGDQLTSFGRGEGLMCHCIITTSI